MIGERRPRRECSEVFIGQTARGDWMVIEGSLGIYTQRVKVHSGSMLESSPNRDRIPSSSVLAGGPVERSCRYGRKPVERAPFRRSTQLRASTFGEGAATGVPHLFSEQGFRQKLEMHKRSSPLHACHFFPHHVESIHPHPTLSETVAFAGEVYLGTATEVYRPKRGRVNN